MPPVPVKFLPLPAIIQLCILVILASESAWGIFEGGSIDGGGNAPILIVAFLIAIEGVCGGLA
jgi:battenin